MNHIMKPFLFLVVLTTCCGVLEGSLESRQISLAGCSSTKQDIIFVVDSSGSVGESNFNMMKAFVKNIINNLDIGADMTRTGVITFSRYPSIRLHLTDFYNKTAISEAVDGIPFISGITDTELAFQLLLQEGFRDARPDVPHIAIVMTDGQSTQPTETEQAAQALKSAGVTIIAVGIGAEVNTDELAKIATDPDSSYVYKVTDFQSLLNISGSLTARTCGVTQVIPLSTVQTTLATYPPLVVDPTVQIQTECNRTIADIMFVLDSSGSLGDANFQLIKQFVIDIVSTLDIGPDYTRVGVITFSNYPRQRITLDAYTDTASLNYAISQIPYFPGNTETDKALDLLRLESFKTGRPEAPDIAIIITDGQSTHDDLTKISAEKVKAAGITVFGIGIGYNISIPELNLISSDPSSYYVYNVSNYSELPKIVIGLTRTTCDIPKLQTTSVATPSIKTTVGPTPPSTTPASCTSKVADVVFVLDNSGSVGSENFRQMKEFVKQTINIFDVGSTYTRVGVISFSSTAQLEFGLDIYSNNTQLINAIDGLPYMAGGTDTGAALELLRKSGFLNERAGVPNIAILITDGRSKNYDATNSQAFLIKEGGSTLIAIGIGNDTDRTELENIASKNPETGSSLVYNVGSYSDLQSLDQVIAAITCGVEYATSSMMTTIPTSTAIHSNCYDAIPNCEAYGRDICSDYKPWATAHCNWYCGFCTGGPSTTPAPCKNNIENCHEYGTYICTEVSLIRWTRTNCPEYCGLCGGNPFPTAAPAKQSTPQPDTVCRNKINNCAEYGGKDKLCKVESYRAWARANCNEYCGFCTEYTTYPGTVLANNVTCPDILLPKECTLKDMGDTCCPIPQCPTGYVMTMKSPLQDV